jgi:hypothetical protein
MPQTIKKIVVTSHVPKVCIRLHVMTSCREIYTFATWRIVVEFMTWCRCMYKDRSGGSYSDRFSNLVACVFVRLVGERYKFVSH